MSELWDCYDRSFHKVKGKFLARDRRAEFSDDEYHLVCDISVRHTDGTYLLTQRDLKKEGYPGMWEFTAGGSALCGESPEECAIRELFEETGLTADEIHEVGRTTVDKNHGHYVVFVATVSCDKDSIVLQEGETIAYKWVTKKEILERQGELATWRIFEMLPGLKDC